MYFPDSKPGPHYNHPNLEHASAFSLVITSSTTKSSKDSKCPTPKSTDKELQSLSSWSTMMGIIIQIVVNLTDAMTYPKNPAWKM